MRYCTRYELTRLVGIDASDSAHDIINKINDINNQVGADQQIKYHPRRNALGHVFDVQVEFDSLKDGTKTRIRDPRIPA